MKNTKQPQWMNLNGTVVQKARASRFSSYQREAHWLPKIPWEAFYSAQELADELRVNIMTIYRYIKAGRLSAYKIGKEYRIDREEFDSFLNKSLTK